MRRSAIEALPLLPHRARRLLPLILPSLLLGAAVSAEAQSATSSVAQPTQADSVRATAPRLFERRVLFNPEYLGRLLATAQRGEVTVEVTPPDERGRAAAYARRYGIDERLATSIIETAVAEGIDPDLGFRLVRVESVFRTTARGPGGALGLTQLMPSTARSVDRSLRTDAEILEPTTNLRIGFRYLRQMIDRYDGDVRLGLLAYNRGSLAVDRALREGRDPENGYSTRVLQAAGDRYTGSGVIDRRR